jgi:cell division protein FtsL
MKHSYHLRSHYYKKAKHFSYKWSYYLFGVIIILLIIQVLVSNRLANSGIKINYLENEIQKSTDKKITMQEKIASASSFMTIIQKSEKLGFTKPATPLFITSELPIALKLK